MAGTKKTRRTTNRLRAWRAREGLTLEEVADLTGLSMSMISLVERGLRELRPMNKVKIARCFQVPIRELFDVDEPPDDQPSNDADVKPIDDEKDLTQGVDPIARLYFDGEAR